MIVTCSEELIKYTCKKTAVALGSFDAIHKGHIAVIGAAIEHARQNDMLSLVQLFEVPPAVMLGAKAINTLEKRLEIIAKLGADIAVVESFDDEFKSIEYADFVTEYLKNRYKSGAVIAGSNYRFGHFAKGDAKSLIELCGQLDIDAKIVDCLELDGIISSTRIREYISSGQVDMAGELMTRPYSISGEVIHGNAVGHKIGFPTANIMLPQDKIIPADGVYSSCVSVDGKSYSGITNIGAKPTVDCCEKNIETHIIDFDGDLYDKTIEVGFLKKIRAIKRFENLEELKKQLQKDKMSI